MKAQIDIKTPAGQSLEGFPYSFELMDSHAFAAGLMFDCYFDLPDNKNIKIHPGDTITITIL